ncbi:MAG: 2OG-Fe(II) oxygenase family protein [Gammaproteobacteria bacterium]|nr:2OG-Fe(II) oxygenase family protein [Gammaproteobacteria bacterium]
MSVYTRVFSQASYDANKEITVGFERLVEDDFNSKTHLFNGRYENLYLDKEKIPGLNIIVDSAMDEAAKILNVEKRNLVSGFWLNSMRPGDVTTAHTHDDDDELLSCVYYIKVPKDTRNSGNLIIIDNNERIEIQPEEGYFVFFSPATLHEVSENKSDEARLSIAFNFGLKIV